MKPTPDQRAALTGAIQKAREQGFAIRNKVGSRAQSRGSGRLSNGSQGGRSLGAEKAEAAYVGYHKTFNDRLLASKAASMYNRLTTVVRTENLVDRNVWISSIPKMRRWLGDKVLNKLRVESWPIYTGPYEASIEVPKNDILNDRLGLYTGQINSMADSYQWLLDDLFIGYLVAGLQGVALGTSYDGQNLIDTDHTYLSTGGTAQSNKVTGALSSTTFNQAWQAFLGFKDENGTPLNIAGRTMTLVAGPAWRTTIKQFLDAEALASGATNTDKGSANYIITPYLTPRTINVNGVNITITGTEWFMVPEASTAVILQEKRAPEFLSVEDGEFPFRTGKYLYGTEAEAGAGYGLWQEVVGGPGV